MGFKNFRVQVIIRLAIIIIACGFLLYYLIIGEKYIRSFYLGIVVIIALIELFYYTDRWNRDVANFFQAILNSDFTNVFSAEKKGKSASSQAITKGKQFEGAIVIDPTPGLHFNVKVMDFASLYPSIISTRNLSYETMMCGHSDCKSNPLYP